MDDTLLSSLKYTRSSDGVSNGLLPSVGASTKNDKQKALLTLVGVLGAATLAAYSFMGPSKQVEIPAGDIFPGEITDRFVNVCGSALIFPASKAGSPTGSEKIFSGGCPMNIISEVYKNSLEMPADGIAYTAQNNFKNSGLKHLNTSNDLGLPPSSLNPKVSSTKQPEIAPSVLYVSQGDSVLDHPYLKMKTFVGTDDRYHLESHPSNFFDLLVPVSVNPEIAMKLEPLTESNGLPTILLPSSVFDKMLEEDGKTLDFTYKGERFSIAVTEDLLRDYRELLNIEQGMTIRSTTSECSGIKTRYLDDVPLPEKYSSQTETAHFINGFRYRSIQSEEIIKRAVELASLPPPSYTDQMEVKPGKHYLTKFEVSVKRKFNLTRKNGLLSAKTNNSGNFEVKVIAIGSQASVDILLDKEARELVIISREAEAPMAKLDSLAAKVGLGHFRSDRRARVRCATVTIPEEIFKSGVSLNSSIGYFENGVFTLKLS